MSQPYTGLSAAKLALTIKRRLDEEQGERLTQSDPIAIIGIGCRFPGNVHSPDEYWRLLLAGVDTIREAPPSRWSPDEWYDADPHAVGKTNGRFGSFLDDADAFDPAFFGLAPREAPFMDPQQRLLLEVTWESLWEAGIAPHTLAGSRTGVFMALCNTDYSRLLLTEPDAIGPNSLTGASHSIASGRISYLLDLQGPSVSIDTACSSSLIAVHLACQSLRAGESRLALAGGVTFHLTPQHYIALAKLGMLAPDGRCKAFDARADGFVPGEGCGVIVLKRLADALADGDHIHAVIRGTATTQDGRTTVLTAPNGLAQQAVVQAALENARVSPEQIGYVETHGTGTALGDPIEVEALAEVLGSTTTDASSPCVLGAVKTNLGHLEAAAGIAGVIKAALALEHEQIPPNLHFTQLNPHISLDETRFVLPTEPYAWPRDKKGRFAGVSSFGFGGTNAHIVLEEAPRVPPLSNPTSESTTSAYVLPISARDPQAVIALAQQYQELLESADMPGSYGIGDICRAAAVRRSHYEERMAVTGSTADTLSAGLRDLIAGQTRAGASRGSAVESNDIVFVCSGQGSQRARMGVELLEQYDVYRTAIDACDTIIRSQAGWSLREQLEADDTTSLLQHTEYAQPAIVATEIALARLWESWGVVPSAVIGHSVGEIAAAHIAGAITLEEAMRIVLQRGRLMERATGCGRMTAVAMSPEQAQPDIARFGETVSIAAINSPHSIVISGEPTAIEAITGEWTRQGISCRPLPVDYAFHSPQMTPFRDELIQTLGHVATQPMHIPMISTVTGTEVDHTALDAVYWGNNIRRPVLLNDALQRTIDRGARTFVEIGPHAVLSLSVQECLAAAPQEVTPGQGLVVSSLRRNQDERNTIFSSLGALYARGVAVDWARVYPGYVPIVPLPVYPYQRQRYWVQQPGKNSAYTTSYRASRSQGKVAGQSGSLGREGRTDPLLGERIQSPLLKGIGYEIELSAETLPFLADHQIGGVTIVPITAMLEMVLEAVADTTRKTATTLSDVVVRQALVLPTTGTRLVQLLLEGTEFRIFSLDDDQWTLHATGQFRASERETPEGPRSTVAVPDIPTGTLVDVREHYRKGWNNGAQFGPAFRTITELSASENAATAAVRLGETEAAEASAYNIHPALLDGCFQPVLATSKASQGPVWVPIAIDRFTVHGQAGAEARSVVSVHESGESGETIAADVWITNPSGQLTATIQGLRCKRISKSLDDTTARFRYRIEWRLHDRSPRTNGVGHNQRSGSVSGTKWLIIAEPDAKSAVSNDVVGQLQRALESRGEPSTVVTSDTLTSATSAQAAVLADLTEYRGIVHLASFAPQDELVSTELDTSVARGCETTLTLVQSLVRQSGPLPPLWIVTRDACWVTADDQCAGFMQAGVLGLARTIAMEHPDLACRTIDLDAASTMASLVDELLSADKEDAIALRPSGRYVARLVPDISGRSAIDEARQLTISVRGTLDNLRFEPQERRAPGPNEIEVSVEATSLNFRDVLNALGMYPGDAGLLGAEFAGRVVRVGDGVTRWSPGDHVMGIGWGSFANYVTTSADLVTNIPDGLDSTTAATLPNAFLTAHHCLLRVAQLKAGDRVLIHAGAGGVGMAAIQLAVHVGAEVFTTAGSPEKREFLRTLGVRHVFDSRTLDFSKQILEATDGQGVDVVLNSLSGDFIAASFAALATRGRFVEIGKIGIWSEIQVAELGKEIDYTVVDLGIDIAQHPAHLGEQLDQIATLVSSGSIKPLPYRAFAFDEAQSAFRYMAQARQIGRVVLVLTPATLVRANATYLITGGLGGIGLRIARWLTEHGATHLVLLGRSAPTAAAQTTIDEMQESGATVVIHTADISNKTKVTESLDTIRQTMPPFRGIVHAAGVVDDGMLVNQNWERFKNVLAPKAYGAWYLHELTRDAELDFFIMCSSVSSIFGAPGQSAYASANAFLDALAARRSKLGQTALSINWGAWADIGMAARVEAHGKRRVLSAIRPMSPDDCLACLEPALRSQSAQYVVLDAEWSQWSEHVPSILSDLVHTPISNAQSASAEHGATQSDALDAPGGTTQIVQQLTAAPVANRRGILVGFINQEARRVLGLGDSHPIDERQSLLKMGLDSLMAVELRNRLASALDQQLPATILFDYPSSAALAEFILSASTPSATTEAVPETDDLLQDIAAMSDEEAERLLARELGAAD